MRPSIPAAILALAASAAQAEGAAPAPMTFAAQRIELPVSERLFPEGPGAETINANCLACHSAGMVLTQPKLTKAKWTETVAKMVKVYHAPVSAEDAATIVDYLTNLEPQP